MYEYPLLFKLIKQKNSYFQTLSDVTGTCNIFYPENILSSLTFSSGQAETRQILTFKTNLQLFTKQEIIGIARKRMICLSMYHRDRICRVFGSSLRANPPSLSLSPPHISTLVRLLPDHRLSNRLYELNKTIQLSWLNDSLGTYKLKCKKLMLV